MSDSGVQHSNLKKIVVVVIGLILLSLFAFAYFWGYPKFLEIKTRLVEHKELLIKIKSSTEREKRIKCMMKTLMTAYDLSEYEAKYYSIIFDDYSQKKQVPWEVFPAVIRIESNFNPTVRSSEGAKGIGQILESTAEELCQKLNIKYVESVTLWNDLLNLILSCEYLVEGINDKAYTDSTQICKLKHGVKRYLGGPAYLKSIKNNESVGGYIKDYKSSVWREFEKLQLMYKGSLAEEID